MVRTRVQEVSLQGRNTQGVRLINVGADEHLVGMARIEDPVDSLDEAAADHEAAPATGLDASSDGLDDEGEAGTETT
jgi:DNA gyrase subunit A